MATANHLPPPNHLHPSRNPFISSRPDPTSPSFDEYVLSSAPYHLSLALPGFNSRVSHTFRPSDELISFLVTPKQKLNIFIFATCLSSAPRLYITEHHSSHHCFPHVYFHSCRHSFIRHSPRQSSPPAPTCLHYLHLPQILLYLLLAFSTECHPWAH